MRFIFLTAFLLYAPAALSQQPPSCTAIAEAGQLDFWTGEWDLTWPGGQGGTPEGETGRATNTITREHNGCVIHERFAAENGFEGESFSVYNPRAGQWKQTWVDNTGGYLLFTGGRTDDGAMELRTEPFSTPQGQEQISRMTWRNVTDGALDWHWQRSTDGGTTWADVWVIRYTRR